MIRSTMHHLQFPGNRRRKKPLSLFDLFQALCRILRCERPMKNMLATVSHQSMTRLQPIPCCSVFAYDRNLKIQAPSR
jgi:hypothetical protein